MFFFINTYATAEESSGHYCTLFGTRMCVFVCVCVNVCVCTTMCEYTRVKQLIPSGVAVLRYCNILYAAAAAVVSR